MQRVSKVVVSRKILRCNWSSTYGETLDKLDPQFVDASVEKVVLSSNEQFGDLVHDTPLNATVKCVYVVSALCCFYVFVHICLSWKVYKYKNVCVY